MRFGFFFFITISYCDDHEEFQQDDKDCWMGDRIGQYTQTVMEPGMTTQKYNPEVPYEGEGFRVNTQVNELVDKLISNRQKMSNVVRRGFFMGTFLINAMQWG